jgi:hypothetical protein
LTTLRTGLKYPHFRLLAGYMNSNQPLPPAKPPLPSVSMDKCEHPRVRIVAREQDSEFVECLECGDIFESSEFKDMAIEERSTGTDA